MLIHHAHVSEPLALLPESIRFRDACEGHDVLSVWLVNQK
jgi:hypothetical protein